MLHRHIPSKKHFSNCVSCVLCRPRESEYNRIMPKIMDVVSQHKKQLEPGEPQLNLCDRAAMVIAFCDSCCAL